MAQLESEADYKKEKYKEAEFNKLFEEIIKYSPFGKWYSYMIGASRMVTKNLKKRIAIDKEGKPIIIYKTQFGKIAGVWATPTHEAIAKDLSQKHYLSALGDLLGVGHIKDMLNQRNKKYSKIYDLSPDEVSQLWAKKLSENPVNKNKIIGAIKKDLTTEQKNISETKQIKDKYLKN